MPDKLCNLYDEIYNSEGAKIRNRLKVHGFSYNIFFGNLYELQKGLETIGKPNYGVILMVSKDKNAKTKAHNEIHRLFHNFLTAAMTLVDHARSFVKKYYNNTLFQKAYSEKIKSEFTENELHRFIQDIRNYMLHNGLPVSEMNLSINIDINDKKGSTFCLKTDRLLEWSGWKSKSKVFLNKQDKTINLFEVVTSYGQKITTHHKWLEQQLYKHHSVELEELDRLILLQEKLELELESKKS